MRKLLSIAITAIVAVATPAWAADPLTFSREGVDYICTDSVVNGKRVIEGHEVRSRKRFRLVVVQGWVTGIYDGERMSYRAPKAFSGVERVAAR